MICWICAFEDANIHQNKKFFDQVQSHGINCVEDLMVIPFFAYCNYHISFITFDYGSYSIQLSHPKSNDNYIIFFSVLIGEFQCWRSNIDTLTLGCYLESHNLRQSMETLTHNHSVLVVDAICRDMNTLSSCSIEEYTKFCGHVTRMVS